MQSLPQRRRVYLMRHGEVSYFPDGRPVPPEGVPLNDEGRAQARAAGPSWRGRVIVARGAVNRVIRGAVLGGGLESFGHLEQDPACINIFDLDERDYGIIRLINYTPYNAIKDGIELTTMERYFLDYRPPSEMRD